MKNILIMIVLLAFVLPAFPKSRWQGNVTVTNQTGQDISRLEYWIGDARQALDPKLVYLPKGQLANGEKRIIPDFFHATDRNTVLIKAHLGGGGFIQVRGSASAAAKNLDFAIQKEFEPVPADALEQLKLELFRLPLRPTPGSHHHTIDNGRQSIFGGLAVLVLDENGREKEFLARCSATELKCAMSLEAIGKQGILEEKKISFSRSSATGLKMPLPFLSFDFSAAHEDLFYYRYKIFGWGVCDWIPPVEGGKPKDLANILTTMDPEKMGLIHNILDQIPGSRIVHYSQAYLFNCFEYDLVCLKKAAADTDLGAGKGFAAGGTNYVAGDESLFKQRIDNRMVACRGDDVTLVFKYLYARRFSQSFAQFAAELKQLSAENGDLKSLIESQSKKGLPAKLPALKLRLDKVVDVNKWIKKGVLLRFLDKDDLKK